MISPEDISAMKVFAILQRGTKKVFFDISLLLDKFGLEKIIKFYQAKYPSNQMLISIPRALIYFDDAEEGGDPVTIKKLTWEAVKKNITKHVNDYLNYKS